MKPEDKLARSYQKTMDQIDDIRKYDSDAGYWVLAMALYGVLAGIGVDLTRIANAMERQSENEEAEI